MIFNMIFKVKGEVRRDMKCTYSIRIPLLFPKRGNFFQLSLPNYFCVTLWTQNSYVRLCDGWGHFNDFFFLPIFQVYFIAYFLSFVVCQIKLHTATHSACISICCSCDQCEIAAWRDYRVCQLPCLNVPWWIVLHY